MTGVIFIMQPPDPLLKYKNQAPPGRIDPWPSVMPFRNSPTFQRSSASQANIFPPPRPSQPATLLNLAKCPVPNYGDRVETPAEKSGRNIKTFEARFELQAA
jgi:hypothetical protein